MLSVNKLFSDEFLARHDSVYTSVINTNNTYQSKGLRLFKFSDAYLDKNDSTSFDKSYYIISQRLKNDSLYAILAYYTTYYTKTRYVEYGQYENAIKKFKTAISYADISEDLIDNVKIYSDLAWLYRNMDSINLAEKYFQLSIEYFDSEKLLHSSEELTYKEKEDLYVYGSALNLYADFDYQRGLYDASLDKLYLAIEYIEKSGTNDIANSIKSNVGHIIYQTTHDYVKATEAFKEAYYELLETKSPRTNPALLTNSIVAIYLENGILDSAEKWLEISKSIEHPDFKAMVNKDISNYEIEIAYQRKKYKEALTGAHNLISEKTTQLVYEMTKKLLLIIQNSHIKLNNTDSAIYYAELNDSIMQERMRLCYENKLDETEKISQAKIKDTRKLLSAMEAKERRIKITYISVIFAIVITFILLRLFIIKKNKNLIDYKNIELTKTNNIKNKLLKIIAHDIKNPLSSISGSIQVAQMQLERGETDKVQDMLELASASSGMINALVNELVVWSKANDKSLSMNRKTVPVISAMNEITKLYSYSMKQKNITLNSTLTPEIKVTADLFILAIVLRNLLDNAIKFSYPNGEIKIYTEEIGDKIKITIEDHGSGMNQEVIDTIISSGQAFIKSGTMGESGTGLGMNLTIFFLNLMDSSLQIESTPEKGSLFSFVLPK